MSTSYRFVLRRSWSSSLAKRTTVNWIMLNPSTATDTTDDATIRRCIGFSKRWGFSDLVVTNLFALRATAPLDLKAIARLDWDKAVGEENDHHIHRVGAYADTIVCAWGNHGSFGHRDEQVVSMLRRHYLYCIRLTVQGAPAHPVREPYTEAPVRFGGYGI